MQKAFDLLRRKGEQPTNWEDIRMSIIAGRETGINEAGFPTIFYISETYRKIFEEMIPPRSAFAEFKHRTSLHLGTGQLGLETSRGVRIKLPSQFVIDGKNNGTPFEHITGAGVARRERPGEIAVFHTHPIDNLPSAVDLVQMIEGKHIFEGIITPRRSYLLFRTTRTPKFPSLVAEGYIMAMGESKKKLPTIYEDLEFMKQAFPNFMAEMSTQKNWQPDINDLNELHILAYEAPRASNLFTKMK